jgi:hypothetical protein
LAEQRQQIEFMLAVSQILGKRLTYAELTGKVAETIFKELPKEERTLDEAAGARDAPLESRFPVSLCASIRVFISSLDTLSMSRTAVVNLANSSVPGGVFMRL